MNTQTITLAMTDSRPVRVSRTLWPVVARGTEDRDHNNQELFRRYYIRVRRHGVACADGHSQIMRYYGGAKDDAQSLRPHRDGQCLVTAVMDTSWQGEANSTAGYRCHLEDVAEYVRTAGEAVGCPEDVIQSALADLPEIDIPELSDLTIEELEAELASRKA